MYTILIPFTTVNYTWSHDDHMTIMWYTIECCIQKMWLGGQIENFQNVGGKVLYNVCTY